MAQGDGDQPEGVGGEEDQQRLEAAVGEDAHALAPAQTEAGESGGQAVAQSPQLGVGHGSIGLAGVGARHAANRGMVGAGGETVFQEVLESLQGDHLDRCWYRLPMFSIIIKNNLREEESC